ncbi:hypothetical protein PFISCL1PPCAC_18938 [Pristionchus fissidentatus]|uniref:F-box domain-containing protein n=1 Tax=Pristionchus fissidentatus TaxID=1538716 RepID=A0AAV5W728_9BILA|nr:hypothetical protein PFISCL1PPCAC_18938 [Pristionchus fissidentatus]
MSQGECDSLVNLMKDVRLHKSLIDLLDEIIDLIFSHLNLSDRCKTRVNRRLFEVVEKMKKKCPFGALTISVTEMDISDFAAFFGDKVMSDCNIKETTVKISEETKDLITVLYRMSTKCTMKKLSVQFLAQLELNMLSISSLFKMVANSTAIWMDVMRPHFIPTWIDHIFLPPFITEILKEKEIVTINVECRALTSSDLTTLYDAFENTPRLGLLCLKIAENSFNDFKNDFMGTQFQINTSWLYDLREDFKKTSPKIDTILRRHKTLHGDCYHVIFHKKTGWESSGDQHEIEIWVREILTSNSFCYDEDCDAEEAIAILMGGAGFGE